MVCLSYATSDCLELVLGSPVHWAPFEVDTFHKLTELLLVLLETRWANSWSACESAIPCFPAAHWAYGISTRFKGCLMFVQTGFLYTGPPKHWGEIFHHSGSIMNSYQPYPSQGFFSKCFIREETTCMTYIYLKYNIVRLLFALPWRMLTFSKWSRKHPDKTSACKT